MDVPSLFRQMGDAMHAGRAFGPAYEADGATVIPLAYVVGGGGGGAGKGPGEPGEDEPEPIPTAGERTRFGMGGGYGFVCLPMGVYVVKDGSARFVPALDLRLFVLVGASLIRAALRRLS